jgi:hypothetical protein
VKRVEYREMDQPVESKTIISRHHPVMAIFSILLGIAFLIMLVLSLNMRPKDAPELSTLAVRLIFAGVSCFPLAGFSLGFIAFRSAKRMASLVGMILNGLELLLVAAFLVLGFLLR